jgi:phenylalanyl-tRNA synthetase beta chain
LVPALSIATTSDKTLTDAEIDPAIEKIVAKLQKDFNANLRG